MLTELRRKTPWSLILACAFFFLASLFVVHIPEVPGASIGSYVSTFLIALPSAIALFRYLGARPATLSILLVSLFAYAVESLGVATGFPYGDFYYGDVLGPRIAGLVPFLLPLSYVPLVIGAVAATWGSRLRFLHMVQATLLLVLMDAVIDPGATSLGFWVWPDGGPYYGVPLSNFAGWLLSGAVATALLLATGRWSGSPTSNLLDSAAIATSFWTGVAVFSSLLTPALLGIVLLTYFLVRRANLRRSPAK